jgi:hypothetical protein
MMTFVKTWKSNLKFIISYHAYGNMLIIPFNFDTSNNSLLTNSFPKASQFYDYLHSTGNLPNGNIKGNGAITVTYTANGEASDYFLGEYGIYSMSPELGTKSQDANTFFITSEQVLVDVVSENYSWLWFTM